MKKGGPIKLFFGRKKTIKIDFTKPGLHFCKVDMNDFPRNGKS